MGRLELVHAVEVRAPFEGEGGAERAVEATLAALCECLPRSRADLVRSTFAVEPVEPARDLETRAEFYARGAELLGEPLGRATEQMQVVCAALARQLEAQDKHELVRVLPSDLTGLFEHAEAHELPPLHGHREPTLGEGRPGATRPLSEAAPARARDPQRGAQHSVDNPNPHGDTKVSSARGLTQEREHQTFAEGRGKRP